MQACRQKHIALLDVRKRDLRKKRHPISPLFEAYLAFATTLGESLMSHCMDWYARPGAPGCAGDGQ